MKYQLPVSKCPIAELLNYILCYGKYLGRPQKRRRSNIHRYDIISCFQNSKQDAFLLLLSLKYDFLARQNVLLKHVVVD